MMQMDTSDHNVPDPDSRPRVLDSDRLCANLQKETRPYRTLPYRARERGFGQGDGSLGRPHIGRPAPNRRVNTRDTLLTQAPGTLTG